MVTYRDIDFHDIPSAFRKAGSNRRYVDTGDYEKVAKEVMTLGGLTARKGIDDLDVSEMIIAAQANKAGDVTVPTSGTLSPVDNATGVAVNVQPAVTFSEQVVFGGGGSFSLYKTTGDVLVYQWNIPDMVGSGPGQARLASTTQVVLRPLVDLLAATQYYIKWTAGVVRDIAGNNVAANASTTAWSFTTA